MCHVKLRLMPYHFHRKCLKSLARRLPLGEAGPKGLKGQGMESRRPEAANFFSALSPLRGALPEGEPAGLPVVSLIPRAFRQLVPHVPQNVLEQASPRGSWPEGPERAGDGIPAANGRQFLLPALSPLSRSSPEGEPSCLWIESFVPSTFSSVSPTCVSKRARAGFPSGKLARRA